jgi:hypothetical protein
MGDGVDCLLQDHEPEPRRGLDQAGHPEDAMMRRARDIITMRFADLGQLEVGRADLAAPPSFSTSIIRSNRATAGGVSPPSSSTHS